MRIENGHYFSLAGWSRSVISSKTDRADIFCSFGNFGQFLFWEAAFCYGTA